MELFHALTERESKQSENQSERNHDQGKARVENDEHDERREHLYRHARKARNDLRVVVGDDGRVARQAVQPLAGVDCVDAAEILSKDVVHEPFLEDVLESRARQFREPSRDGRQCELEQNENDDIDSAPDEAVQVLVDGAVDDVAEEDRVQNTARAA